MATRLAQPQSGSESEATGLTQLLSAKQSAVLAVIEDLRHIGNDSRYEIDLPRIIVCGDQSCGKSSVLEAISRLNFPRDESTCTTFATELTLDNRSESPVSVEIIWDKTKKAERLHPTNASVDGLGTTINEAKRMMESRHAGDGHTFFKDVLQIKASNPTWPPLTLVDLPGVVHAGVDKDEQAHNLNIITSYMSRPNTIILVVASAGRDPDSFAMLESAREYDPRGIRTMGIITKPDRVESLVSEQKWIDMALQKSARYKFELGWHVVKNRGPGEMGTTFHERDQKEKEFFNNSAWSRALDTDQLGIDNLRVRLSKTLEDRTRSALPGILRKLKEKLAECQHALKVLGPSRLTLGDQQIYLTRIATLFSALTKEAVNACYEEDFFHKEGDRNLYALIKSQNNTFVEWMHSWGHSYEEAGPSIGPDSKPSQMPQILQHLGPPERIPKLEFIAKLEYMQIKCGGHEFNGMFNPAHFKQLFQEQSKNWRKIAHVHLHNVWNTTRQFLIDAVRHAVRPGNNHTADALILHIIEPAMESKRSSLFVKLEEFLRPYEKFPVMAHDPEFARERETLYRRLHDKEMIAKHISNDYDKGTAHIISQKLSTYEMGNPEYPSDNSLILELLKLYYKNAMRTFINNIISLAVYDCLLYELQDLFNSMKILEISRDDKQLLEALANEPDETRKRRADLEQQQQDLQEALAKCTKQFPDINIYMMQNDDRYDSSIAARPSVDLPPPRLNVLTPLSSSRNSSVSIPSAQTPSPAMLSFPGTLPTSSKNPDTKTFNT